MKRKWFQVHLSTVIVLTFVSGGLVLLNLKPSAARIAYVSYGWPMTLMTRNSEGVICFRCSENEYRDPMRPVSIFKVCRRGFHSLHGQPAFCADSLRMADPPPRGTQSMSESGFRFIFSLRLARRATACQAIVYKPCRNAAPAATAL
jgi:hypothetical protein